MSDYKAEGPKDDVYENATASQDDSGSGGRKLFEKSPRTTFDTGSLDFSHQPVEGYEGLHRYDPSFEWTIQEEKQVVRKMDWKITSWMCLMFFALLLDRNNISQALSDNMLGDLHLNTNDYNTGQTIYFICWLIAELPSQMISKKIGPEKWIPIQLMAWSLIAAMQCFMSGRDSFWACRALLGLFEGGFIPDTVLYLSYFFTSYELPKRITACLVVAQATPIISAFLAYGILHMRGVTTVLPFAWQWLFLIEGIITGIIGLMSWFYLPASPTQTVSRIRKNGWFTVQQEKIIVNRILRDDPSKGDMHNRQGIRFDTFWASLKEYHMWPCYLLGFTWILPQIPIAAYLTLQLKAAGFGTFQTNLLTIPAYVLYIVICAFVTWLSDKLNERFLLASLSQFWALPLLIALETLPANRSPWVSWALAVLLYAMPYFHPVIMAVISRNSGSVRTRTVASCLYSMAVQVSNIIGANIYRESDKPQYYTGNKILLAIVAYNICLFWATKLFYIHVNKRRDRVWHAMSKEQKETYLLTTKDRGNMRLNFRFAH